VRAVELSWNVEVRSAEPDPLGADIVHVREDRRNGAGLAGRFGSPGGRIKMFDKDLVDPIVGGKHLDCGRTGLSVNLILMGGHRTLLVTAFCLLPTAFHRAQAMPSSLRPTRIRFSTCQLARFSTAI
jgi:hypothetical protein